MNVFVVVAHPDDEVLGPGATLHRLANQGARVHALIVCDGVAARHGRVDTDDARAASRRAADILGISQLDFGGLGADRRLLDEHPNRALVGLIDEFLGRAPIDVLFTHHRHDPHVDHRCVAYACAYAARSIGANPARRLLAFEVLSATEQASGFAPNSFSRLQASDIEAKQRALAVYAHEVCAFPHPRSIEGVAALGRYRGLHVGAEWAEAFLLEREEW